MLHLFRTSRTFSHTPTPFLIFLLSSPHLSFLYISLLRSYIAIFHLRECTPH
ncbi:hypothetical protein HOY80DRAFT_1137828, partial [Tuber brumale]